MHITLAFMAIVYMLIVYTGASEKTRIEIILTGHVQVGRALFFSMQNTTLNPFSPENIAFASFSIVVSLVHNWVDSSVVSIIYGALPLTFWLATRDFQAAILNTCESLENGENGSTILEKYNELKILTRSINSIWTTLVLTHVMEMFIRIIWVHYYIARGNIIWYVYFGLKTLFLVVGLLLMAEGCRTVILFMMKIFQSCFIIRSLYVLVSISF